MTARDRAPWVMCVFVLCTLAPVALAAEGEPVRVVTTSIEPFFYLENGRPRGIEYEILNYFATAENRELEVRFVDSFKEVLPALERGEADIASAAITITGERSKRFDFSASYFPSQLVILMPSGEGVDDPSALAGKRIGILAGSTSREAITGVDVDLVEGDDIRSLYEATARGELDGVVTATARALLLLDEFESLDIALTLGRGEEFGFAVSSGSPLAPALTKHLREIKVAGIYFRLLEKYLGPKAVSIVQAGQK